MPMVKLFITLVSLLSLLVQTPSAKTTRRTSRFKQDATDTIPSDDKAAARQLDQQTEIPVLLQLQGQPGLLNDYEYTVLEETFVMAYTTLKQNVCPEAPTSTSAIAIDIGRDVSTFTSPGDGTITRIFTLSSLVTLWSNDSRLFSSSAEIAVRRQQRKLPDASKSRRRLSRSSGKGGKGRKSGASPLIPTAAPVDNNVDTTQTTNCPGLTEQVFTLAFREAVQTKSGEFGTSIVDVTTVAEMGSVECNHSISNFGADLIITFVGDPTLWTLSQEEILQESFLQTYHSSNSLNPKTCDLLFRQVTNVTIFQEGEFNRRALDNDNRRNLGSTFSFLYRTNGKCRGCQANARLFDQGSSGRNLESTSAVTLPVNGPKSTRRRLQSDNDDDDDDDDCKCPITASKSRAPTIDEFREAYETAIDILKQEYVMDPSFIESIVDIREVQQVACEPTETFETLVNVQLLGIPSAVEENEVHALEHGFISTYKQLSGNYCDPLFRTPIEVTIDTAILRGRRLQSSSSTTFTYQYRVKGVCRGCGRNGRLFGQSVRRMLSGINGGTILQDNPCFCNHVSLADRPPTQEEFAIAYNETVQNLNLPHIQHVVAVEEQDFEAAGGTSEHDEVHISLPVVTTSVSTMSDGNTPTTTPAPTFEPTCSPP